MKKYILTTTIAVLCLTNCVLAQGDNLDPALLNIKPENSNLEFTVGGRLMADMAYYHSDFTVLKSGAAISDARVRASLKYNKLYFYADFDFTGGKFSQKDLYLRYNIKEGENGTHSIKAGFYADPASMGYNTSRYQYHFISRAAPIQALVAGRQLGVTYKFYNKHMLLDQGVFAENRYNNQAAGYQGITLAGRWVYKALRTDDMTLHAGAAVRYAKMNTGYVENNIFKQSQSFGSSLETSVDANEQFLHVDLPWASNNLNLSGELLFHTSRLFARGEYLYKHVGKTQPTQELLEAQLGGLWSAGNAATYQKFIPFRNNSFSGAYLELGYLLRGNRYTYNDEMGVLNGMNDNNALEVVARYSFVDLNDITDGEYFLRGSKKFYAGEMTSAAANATADPAGYYYYMDYPLPSTSVPGGKAHLVSLGVNYTFNRYIKLMAEYKYTQVDHYYYDLDRNMHAAQLKMMFSF
jgi:phosphate-selective porin OprO/OprP